MNKVFLYGKVKEKPIIMERDDGCKVAKMILCVKEMDSNGSVVENNMQLFLINEFVVNKLINNQSNILDCAIAVSGRIAPIANGDGVGVIVDKIDLKSNYEYKTNQNVSNPEDSFAGLLEEDKEGKGESDLPF